MERSRVLDVVPENRSKPVLDITVEEARAWDPLDVGLRQEKSEIDGRDLVASLVLHFLLAAGVPAEHDEGEDDGDGEGDPPAFWDFGEDGAEVEAFHDGEGDKVEGYQI